MSEFSALGTPVDTEHVPEEWVPLGDQVVHDVNQQVPPPDDYGRQPSALPAFDNAAVAEARTDEQRIRAARRTGAEGPTARRTGTTSALGDHPGSNAHDNSPPGFLVRSQAMFRN